MTLHVAVNVVNDEFSLEQLHSDLCNYLSTDDVNFEYFVCNNKSTETADLEKVGLVVSSDKRKETESIKKLSTSENKQLLQGAQELVKWSYRTNINTIKMTERSYKQRRYDMVITPGASISAHKINPYNLKPVEQGTLYARGSYDHKAFFTVEYSCNVADLSTLFKLSNYWKFISYDIDDYYKIHMWWDYARDNCSNYLFTSWANMQSVKLRNLHGF